MCAGKGETRKARPPRVFKEIQQKDRISTGQIEIATAGHKHAPSNYPKHVRRGTERKAGRRKGQGARRKARPSECSKSVSNRESSAVINRERSNYQNMCAGKGETKGKTPKSVRAIQQTQMIANPRRGGRTKTCAREKARHERQDPQECSKKYSRRTELAPDR